MNRNVILIFLDSLRKDHVGALGNPWIETPNLDAFSSESINFTQAYPESLATLPVRRSTMTGNRVYPFKDWRPTIGEFIKAPGWQPLAETDITISEIFYEAGYRTAFITDVYHMFKPSMNFHRGFREWRFFRGQELDTYDCSTADLDYDHYLTPKMKGLVAETQTKQYLTNVRDRRGEKDHFGPKVFQEAMDWLDRNRGAENFYLHIDCFDPHEPWDPPKKYWSLYDDPDYSGRQIICPDYDDPLRFMSERELKHVRALYAGEVSMVDHWFGKFINRLKEVKMDRDTLVVVLSDHGHPLGEHGIIRKNPAAMYPEQIDIFMMLRLPDGSRAGEQIEGYVYNHDLFTTMINFSGVKIPHTVEGKDLLALKDKRDYATCAFKGVVWSKTDDYVYFSLMNGQNAKLFDLREDPGQFDDIAKDKPGVTKEMFDLTRRDAGGELPDYSHLQGQLGQASFSTALSAAKK